MTRLPPAYVALIALGVLGALATSSAGNVACAQTLFYDGRHFRIRPLIAIVTDYTFFAQDDPSLVQVGEQEDTPDLRAARVGVIARTKSRRPWILTFAIDYQEARRRDEHLFQLYDLRLRIPIGPLNVEIGKQKQPFVFEVVGLSILNAQQERILNPFFVTRSIGVVVSGQLFGDRMTWAASWYNDWLEEGAGFSDNANDYVARVTGLVLASPDNLDYLHLGIAFRRAGPDAGTIRLSGRPESNVADKYVDTGDFSADYAGEVGLEFVLDRGPFMLIAEHVETRIEAPESENPRMWGSYVLVSWMITGESRPYNRIAGATSGVEPRSSLGAFELVARFSHLDMTDGLIDGGVLDKWYFGANWWISAQWKAGAGYGLAYLDRDNLVGKTQLMLLRLQWYY